MKRRSNKRKFRKGIKKTFKKRGKRLKRYTIGSRGGIRL